MSPLFVGFGHKKRVGKNLLASLLSKQLDSVQIVSFADPLYFVAHYLYHWAGFGTKEFYETYPHLKETVLPDIGKTPRQILIDLGTPAIRQQVFSETWTNWLMKSKHTTRVVLVTDVRFPNEFEAIAKSGGLLVRVDRPSIPNTDDIADTALDGKKDSDWSLIITNDCTLKNLEGKLMELVKLVRQNDSSC